MIPADLWQDWDFRPNHIGSMFNEKDRIIHKFLIISRSQVNEA